MRYLEPLANVAILLTALLACGGGEGSKPGPTGGPTPKEICAKLTAAGLVKNCAGGEAEGPIGWGCSFDVVGIAGYSGSIMAYNAQEYPGFVADAERVNKQAAHDDYPELWIIHPTTRTIISWSAKLDKQAKGTLDTAEGNRWEACIKAHKAVAACAKAQPAYYAANKALYEAAKRAVGK